MAVHKNLIKSDPMTYGFERFEHLALILVL